jgi:hypothetical protein
MELAAPRAAARRLGARRQEGVAEEPLATRQGSTTPSSPYFRNDGVLYLAFDTAELIAPWCELQRPQPG